MKKKILLLLFSFIGLVDSIYLSLPYVSGVTTYCSLGEKLSCDVVLNSQYSDLFFGIPNAFLGVLFYLSLILIFSFFKTSFKNKLLKLSILLTFTASILYIYFIYLQAFVIKAFCLYCLTSAFLTFLIFSILLSCYLKNKKTLL